MTVLEQFTEFTYYHLCNVPFIGRALNQIDKETVKAKFCPRCGRMASWITVPPKLINGVPRFDETTGDVFQYDELLCSMRVLVWLPFLKWFKRPAMAPCWRFQIFRRHALRKSK